MNKWDYLIESDRDFRAIERRWQHSGSDEDANTFVRAARSVGAASGDDYNRALWQIGEGPTTSEIHRQSLYLSSTLDQLILEFNNNRGGGSQSEAGDILLGASKRSNRMLYSRFSGNIERGITNPEHVDFNSVAVTVDQARKDLIPNLRRERVSPRNITSFLRALTSYQQLIGR